jgi:hypothetical protein
MSGRGQHDRGYGAPAAAAGAYGTDPVPPGWATPSPGVRRGPTDCVAGLEWCAGGHRCQPRLGEHRSEPWTIRTRYGVIVATRLRQHGRDRLEMRTLVELPADQARARRLAHWVLIGVDRALRRITAALSRT